MKYYIIIANLFFFGLAFCQKDIKLSVGANIPFKNVEVFNIKNEKTYLDLPNRKSLSDRFVLVYFYDATLPTKELIAFNNQIEHILNKYQNNACKGASDIEYATICLEKDFKKWETVLTETGYNKTKFTGKKINYLAKDGLKDKACEAFKVKKTPTLFLVNPLGKLYIESDNIFDLEDAFKNICRSNSSYATADISGKLLSGEKIKSPLTTHKVYLVEREKDTIKTTSTDDYGDFVFKQIDTSKTLSIRIEQNEKTKTNSKVYLARQTGEIVSEFKKNANGNFEYKLLEVDVRNLTEIEDDNDITFKFKLFNTTSKKDLTITENIYYDLAKYIIVSEAEIVLDKIVIILNSNPNVQLQVISHTDAQGDDAGNLKLAQNRSNSVIDYLILKGISKNRLKGIGKGETEIRNRCANNVACSDKEHEYNRRTEFKFIKN